MSDPIAWLGPIEDWGRFRTARTDYHCRPVVHLADYESLAAELAAAREELAALRRDAERLDFIGRQRFEVTPIEGGGWDVSALDSEGGHPTLIGSRVDLRAAIDEAMEQSQ